jgi:hypothetical protein
VDTAIFGAASRASKATDFILAFRAPADGMSQHEAVAHDPERSNISQNLGTGLMPIEIAPSAMGPLLVN